MRSIRILVMSLLATLVAAFPMTMASGVAGFGDVPADKFYTAAVQWMSTNGITTGVTPECFEPDSPVTRGQLAAFMFRMEGSPSGSPDHSFTDVVAAYQHAPISWLKARDITIGTSPTTFSPDATLTRGQLAAMLYRLAGNPPAAPSGFGDVVKPWQISAVGWMLAQEITTGTSPTTFSPDSNVTRGQLAAFFYRYKNSPPVVVDPSSPRCGPPLTFGSGTHLVGSDISPGTYRAAPTSSCYWARLSGLGGSLSDIITNEFTTSASTIVTISPGDVAFKAGSGCGIFTTDLSSGRASTSASFSSGSYRVGPDVAAGIWRSDQGDGCYWQRNSGWSGSLSDIITNDFTNSPGIVQILPTDIGFLTTDGCGTWSRIG